MEKCSKEVLKQLRVMATKTKEKVPNKIEPGYALGFETTSMWLPCEKCGYGHMWQKGKGWVC